MVIALGRTKGHGLLGVEEGEIVAPPGEPGRGQPMTRCGQFDPLGGEEQIVAGDHAFKQVDALVGVGVIVLMEQDHVGAPRLVRMHPHRATDRSQIGVGEGADPVSRGRRPCGHRRVAWIRLVGRADHRDGLGSQAVLQGPPGRREPRLGPAGERGLTPSLPFVLGPVSGYDRPEILGEKFQGPAGGLQHDDPGSRLAVELDRAPLGEVEEIGLADARPGGDRQGPRHAPPKDTNPPRSPHGLSLPGRAIPRPASRCACDPDATCIPGRCEPGERSTLNPLHRPIASVTLRVRLPAR